MTRKIDLGDMNLGDKVKCSITGIEGILWAITEWMTGCNHVGIKREGVDKDGKPHELHWVDEPLVTKTGSEVFAVAGRDSTGRTNNRPGGPALERRPTQER